MNSIIPSILKMTNSSSFFTANEENVVIDHQQAKIIGKIAFVFITFHYSVSPTSVNVSPLLYPRLAMYGYVMSVPYGDRWGITDNGVYGYLGSTTLTMHSSDTPANRYFHFTGVLLLA